MSEYKFTYTREAYKGIEVLCIRELNLRNVDYRDIKNILYELDEIMFLPKRVIYTGTTERWEGFNSDTRSYMYVGDSRTKESAKRSIVLSNL